MFRTGKTTGFKSVLAVAMFAQASFCMLQRGSTVVTAFSLATTLSSRSVSSVAASSGSHNALLPAFYRASARTASSMKLEMSSTVVEKDLSQKAAVEHSAYEIVNKDFIEEYGAAATLYRHKKSGAELLSVSTDDDNKVFGVTFRTPRKFIIERSPGTSSRVYNKLDSIRRD